MRLVKDKKKLKEAASKFGSGLKQILVAAASHPTTAGIAVMTLTVIAKELVTQGRKDTEWRRRFNNEMGGLYAGAQGLAATAAVVPVAVGGLNLLQTAVAAKKGG